MPLAVRIFLPILLFPIEVFSHLARVLSLTVRLFANMFAGEMVTLVFFSLVPLGIPIIFEGLHVGVSIHSDIYFCVAALPFIWERRRHTSTREGLRSQVSGLRKNKTQFP